MSNKSPCLTCTRVKDPRDCENKTCERWRRWFISWWEGVREKYILEPQKEDCSDQ